ncbi:MAG TPA: hypothetical protein VGF60_17820 [Xanthobacteraceae bacterium]|jgi:hypothetical protein
MSAPDALRRVRACAEEPGEGGPSGPGSTERLRELLEQSLLAWRLDGSVGRAGDGSIHVRCNGTEIRIARAPSALPFRWMVTVGGRRRGAISVVAVLRQLRAALDPAFVPRRVHVAGSAVVPP